MATTAPPTSEAPRRRVPTWLRVLSVIAALAVLLVVADRVTERVAAHATAEQLRTSQNLAQDPEVDFLGFPFLTQALRGHFDEVDITASDVETPVLPIARVQTRLFGVQAGLGDALAGRLQAVPVARADGAVSLRYRDLDALLADRLAGSSGVLRSLRDPVLAERNGRLAVSARADVLGQSVPVEIECTVPVDDTGISVVPQRVRLPLLGDQAVPPDVGNRFAVRVPTQGLPFGVRVRAVLVTPEGLDVTGDSTGFVLVNPR